MKNESIIEICKKFKETRISLRFLQITVDPYEQAMSHFYPNLSILDLIANLSVDNVIKSIDGFSIE